MVDGREKNNFDKMKIHEFVQIEFIRVWGHPTKNLIMGVGSKARVSEYLCGILERGGYVKRTENKNVKRKDEQETI